MQFKNQLICAAVYIFATLLAACTALPINVTSLDHSNELLIGVFALICISIVIAACTCCHRNKSGFELSQIKDRKEFENENTLTDHTNSRSEFPIFRAISPQNAGQALCSNNEENNVDNRILSNIVNQNQMNRTFNEFENNQNNNGPISTADLENIQNNNASDYIPNRNETNITIEPSPYSINRNLINVNNNGDGASTSTSNVQPLPMPMVDAHANDINTEIRYESESFAGCSSTYQPHLQTPYVSNEVANHCSNEINRNVDTNNAEATAIAAGNEPMLSTNKNYDSQEPNAVQRNIESNLSNEFNELSHNITDSKHLSNNSKELNATTECQEINSQVTEMVCEKVIASSHLQQSHANHADIGSDDVECQTISQNVDDAISVEEALRALDFAISGGESLLSGYDDDDDYDDDTLNGDENGEEQEEEDADSNVDSECDKATDYQQMPDENIEGTSSSNECLIANAEPQNIDAKYNDSLDKLEDAVEGAEITQNTITQCYELSDVYDVAKSLVDSILERTQDIIMSNSLNATVSTRLEPKIAADTTVDVVPESPKDLAKEIVVETVHEVNLDDSLEETFIVGKLEASTPCHKVGTLNEGKKSKTIASNLFSALDEVNESCISNDGVGILLEKTETKVVNATFEVEPIANNLTTTFVKCDDATFTAPPNKSTCLSNETFDADSTRTLGTAPAHESHRLPKISPTIKIDKEEATSDDLTTITPMNTPCELNYAGETWDNFVSKSLNQQNRNVQVFDTNSGCAPEKSTSSNAWFLHPQQDVTCNINATYDMNDVEDTYDRDEDINDDDDDSVEENVELLSLTFDALRKQLAEALPHASSGNIAPNVDFSDDDNDCDSDDDCENGAYQARERCDSAQSEVVINYKQQLSPILEESEDETCKTFIMNETKCLDSTSTGCIETGEAIMGVTKVLMASNDTLFNFEDTLGDRDDMFSPRNPSSSGNNTLTANTPQPTNCKTPTNEMYLNSIDNRIHENHQAFEQQSSAAEAKSNLIPFNFENIEQINPVTDLLSPEQPKTLSEEINTIEQLSSDLSATVDATTNTLDDLKTCISVHLKSDDKSDNSKSVESDADDAIESAQPNDSLSNETNAEMDDPIESNCKELHNDSNASDAESANSSNTQANVGNTETVLKKSDDFCDNQETNAESPESNDSAKENKNPNLSSDSSGFVRKMIAKHDDNRMISMDSSDKHNDDSQPLKKIDKFDVSATEHDVYRAKNELVIDLTKHMPLHNNISICEIDTRNEQNCLITSDDVAGQLSGEEDPWAAHPITEIRFSGPGADYIRTSFASNDWDSDIEDSNSSEEFMYVKGTTQMDDFLKSTHNNSLMNTKSPTKIANNASSTDDETIDKSPIDEINHKLQLEEKGNEQTDIHSIWNSHEDLIAVSSNADVDSADDILDETSSSDNEAEWVPSSWDSLAKPARSALKSPDKSSSKNANKSRRSVVFKKQNYQSVYEYPKESSALSPARNEPQMWATYLANSSPFSSASNSEEDGAIGNFNENGNHPMEFNGADGFAISSSTRPFHSSQFSAECHTWPTETEFSWSQLQGDNEAGATDKFPSYSSIPIEWPKNLSKPYIGASTSEENQENKDATNHRPDYSVGESADGLTESMSLGELRHTKALLRLPLNTISSPTDANLKVSNAQNQQNLNSNTDDVNAATINSSAAAGLDGVSSAKSQHETNSETILASDSTDSIIHTSCTGSMDSINSFDGGKNSQSNLDGSTNDDASPINGSSSDANEVKTILDHDDEEVGGEDTKQRQHQPAVTDIKKSSSRSSANRQSDSTDEDSGIESIIRIAKEI